MWNKYIGILKPKNSRAEKGDIRRYLMYDKNGETHMREKLRNFFSKSPGSLPLYEALEKTILGFEGVKTDIGKSQVSFGVKRKFAWVWLPVRKVSGRPDTYVVLTFGLGHRIADTKIVQSVEPYPGRWTHHVIIGNTEDVDDDVKRWLKMAYDFANR